MKILFFSRLFYTHIGGVEKHVREISKILIKKGYGVTVLTETLDGPDEIDGIKIVRVNNGKDTWFKKFRVWKNIYKNLILIHEADIIHVHDVFFWILPFKIIFPFKKVFITFHGYEGNDLPGFKSKFVRKAAEDLTNGNICVGAFIEKWYGTKADFITYGGVNSPRSLLKPNAKSKKEINILFLGRLEEDNGLKIFTDSVKQLIEMGYKIKFSALGDGSLKKNVEKVGGRVLGYRENINEFIRASDIIFSSSYLSILESLSYGKVVFSAYNNRLKEDYLRMSSFADLVIIENSSQIIAEKVIDYTKTRKYSEKVRKGRGWVSLQTWEKVASLYLKLWEK